MKKTTLFLIPSCLFVASCTNPSNKCYQFDDERVCADTIYRTRTCLDRFLLYGKKEKLEEDKIYTIDDFPYVELIDVIECTEEAYEQAGTKEEDQNDRMFIVYFENYLFSLDKYHDYYMAFYEDERFDNMVQHIWNDPEWPDNEFIHEAEKNAGRSH